MKLELKIYGALCATEFFVINGIEADSRDFGEDEFLPDGEYGCENRNFYPRPHTESVLKKYGITVPEYNFVADQLSAGLSFGPCGLCS